MYRRSLALNPYQAEVNSRVSGMTGIPQTQPQSLAAYAPQQPMYSQSAMPMPAPIQQASYYQPQPYQQPQPMLSQQMMAPQMMASQASPYPVMQAGSFSQSTVDDKFPGSAQPMMQGTSAFPIQQVQYLEAGPNYGAAINGQQAYGPMTMSSVPIVTPF